MIFGGVEASRMKYEQLPIVLFHVLHPTTTTTGKSWARARRHIGFEWARRVVRESLIVGARAVYCPHTTDTFSSNQTANQLVCTETAAGIVHQVYIDCGFVYHRRLLAGWTDKERARAGRE